MGIYMGTTPGLDAQISWNPREGFVISTKDLSIFDMIRRRLDGGNADAQKLAGIMRSLLGELLDRPTTKSKNPSNPVIYFSLIGGYIGMILRDINDNMNKKVQNK